MTNPIFHTPPAPGGPADGPFISAALAYTKAGWAGTLPLPPRKKKTPPEGWTGAVGIDPSRADIQAWLDDPTTVHKNIALRMPNNVIGIDVDHYDGKQGGRSLAAMEDKHGHLPATWRSTSRDDGVSAIRYYQVPEGLKWPGDLGNGIEIIQRRHRYAVAPPSIHPEGRPYRWVTPDMVTAIPGVYPKVDDLPYLPDEWVEALTAGEAAEDIARADLDDSAMGVWIGATGGTPCSLVETALGTYVKQLRGNEKARHEVAKNGTVRLARLHGEGHKGSSEALKRLHSAWSSSLTDSRSTGEAAGEWNRLLAGGIKIAAAEHPTPSTSDPCEWPLLLVPAPQATEAPPPVGPIDGDPAAPMTEQEEEQNDQLIEAVAAFNREVAIEVVRLRVRETAKRQHLDELRTEAIGEAANVDRYVDGAKFILDVPETTPAVWGEGDRVLWARGEALMVVGGNGVGKTTLAAQLIRCRVGLSMNVLDLPVEPGEGKVLYLAMDRPEQARRALHRLFTPDQRGILEEKLVFWKGPPPTDLAKATDQLTEMCLKVGADTVVIDSLKDAAIGLSEDEIGASWNRARQTAIAAGVEVLELHHMVKRGANGAEPTSIADVYGSAWLTAGSGSVISLFGAPGDPIVSMRHLKQPADEVGPWRVRHDHDRGVSEVFHRVDLMQLAGHAEGITARGAAVSMFEVEKPSEPQLEKARRKLDGLVRSGALRMVPATGVKSPARYFGVSVLVGQSPPSVNPTVPHVSHSETPHGNPTQPHVFTNPQVTAPRSTPRNPTAESGSDPTGNPPKGGAGGFPEWSDEDPVTSDQETLYLDDDDLLINPDTGEVMS